MEELSEARVVENAGFAGCSHRRPRGRRQVLLMDIETLRAMDLSPGMVRENITTEGLEVNALRVGQRLRVGEVQLEVSMVCAPCEEIEKLRAGLQQQMVGRRGMFCHVLRGGLVKPGDPIELQA
jgi:MOSC domain-containing protein YiiM